MARLLLALALLPGIAAAQQAAPIIDMHLHASHIAEFAGLLGTQPPLPHCVPMTSYPVPATGAQWPEVMRSPDLPCRKMMSAVSDTELTRRSLAVLERRNIYAVTSGGPVGDWVRAAPSRIMPAIAFGDPGSPSPDSLRALVRAGRYMAFAEVAVQYGGMEPDDPALRPYWALAEELDIPVGIHIGTGPVGAPYLAPFNRYRARLHSPLLLEEVLLRHPRLRVYIMHAGWPMLDDLLAMLWTHPQLYVDVGAIDWALPRAEFHYYLRRIVEAGFGNRVMFGSDQMVWPEAIELALAAINSATFLTAAQKRDILYNNAARFLRLTDADLARHRGR